MNKPVANFYELMVTLFTKKIITFGENIPHVHHRNKVVDVTLDTLCHSRVLDFHGYVSAVMQSG
jgi:hypothetical protein